MWNDWLIAFGLMLVLEGMTPFLFPAQWREALQRAAQLQDGQLRTFGLMMMLAGTLFVYWVS
jgi:uncharacterized protein YjeT (DUF2065 family)